VADREVSDEVLEQLTTYSDGVPLFAEALADTWLNAEDLEFSIDNMTVPAGLYDLLYTPLDGLGDNKRILQLGAALGQEFEYNALAALWDKDETTLQAGLEKLAELGLVYPRGQVPYATYQFKYKLMRVVAYQTLMRDQREALYARISQLGLNEEKGLEI